MGTEESFAPGKCWLENCKELLISSRYVVLTHILTVTFYVTLFKKIFYSLIYLAAQGLSCGTKDLCCVTRDFSLWRTNSLVVACGVGCSAAWGVVISLIRDQTCIPCIVRWVLHHWTTREVPQYYSLIMRYLPIQCNTLKKHLSLKQDLSVYSNSVTLSMKRGKAFYFLQFLNL